MQSTQMIQRVENSKPSMDTSEIERVLIGGDLSRLSAEQRMEYLRLVCKSLGLNPLTQPFAYITLSGRLTLYAKKDCTEQLRAIHGISVQITSSESMEGVYVVRASALRPDGRADSSIGAVSIEGLRGEAKANAMMKAETKAKRRVTLSICGLGLLDESELESIPEAVPVVPVETPAAVAERRIAELKAQAKVEPEVPAAVRKIWEEMKTSKQAIQKVIAGFAHDLREAAGDEEGMRIFEDILKRYGAGDPVARVGLARETVWQLWKALQHIQGADTQTELDIPQESGVVYAD